MLYLFIIYSLRLTCKVLPLPYDFNFVNCNQISFVVVFEAAGVQSNIQRAHSTKKTKRNAVLSAHSCQGGGGVEASIHLLESKSQQVHKLFSSNFFLKSWLYRVHIFSLNTCHGLSLPNKANLYHFYIINLS